MKVEEKMGNRCEGEDSGEEKRQRRTDGGVEEGETEEKEHENDGRDREEEEECV